jgi:AraC-like DNA-binding protein
MAVDGLAAYGVGVDVMVGRRPATALRGLVDWYAGYCLADAPVRIHRGLPSRHLTVVLTLDRPLEMAAMPDERQPPGVFDALIGGLHHCAAGIRMGGPQAGIQLAVTPAGARRLFGCPAGELRSSVLPLADVLVDADRLLAQLREAVTWRQRFAVLETALLRRLHEPARDPRPEVAWAWDQLVRRRGDAAVSALAADVGWSRRHLSNTFDREFGLSPKVAARVLRFDHSADRLRTDPSARLADVAAIAGFADQAHMCRDWRQLAGCSPSRWLAEEFPYVQAGEDPAEEYA